VTRLTTRSRFFYLPSSIFIFYLPFSPAGDRAAGLAKRERGRGRRRQMEDRR
jgi:hypothetical protein